MKKLLTCCQLLLSLCLYVPVPVIAQDCNNSVQIEVLDDVSGQPIASALVILQAAGSTNSVIVYSDSSGRVQIPHLCGITYKLQAKQLGYESRKMNLQIRKDTTLRLLLHEQHEELTGVDVVTHRQAIESSNSMSELRNKDLEKLKGNSLSAIVSEVPGVRQLQTGGTIAKPVINGMSGNRIAIINNGIKQEGQQWGREHAPEIDPTIAQKISVVRGSEAIRYGSEALGGIILVDPSALYYGQKLQSNISAFGQSNGRGGGLSGSIGSGFTKLKGLAWKAQGSIKQTGNISTPGYYMDNTGVKERSYSLALGYDAEKWNVELYYSHFASTLGIFKGAHIGSLEDLKVLIANGRPFDDGSFSYVTDAPKQEVAHDLAKLSAHYHISNHVHLNYLFGLQKDSRKEYDLRRAGRSNIPSIDLSLWAFNHDLNMEYFNDKGFKAITGINVLSQSNENVPGTFARPLIPNYSQNGMALYAIARKSYKKAEWDAGLRYDFRQLNAQGYTSAGTYFNNNHNFNTLAASLGGLWRPAKNLELRSNIGSAWRPPAINELYSNGLHHGVAAIEIGKTGLSTEKSLKWMNTLSWQYHNVKLWGNAYAHYIYDYIYLMPSDSFQQSLRGAFPVYFYEQTDARFLGIDIQAMYTFREAWQYHASASWLRARDIGNNTFLPWIPSDRYAHTLQYQPQHQKWKDAYIELEHVFVARQNRVAPNSDFAPAPGAYHLLNFKVGKDWILNNKQRIGAHLSISNLGNTLYKDYLNRLRYYAHETGRNITLRLNYSF